ncbi:MAG: gliding motility-associated C-terminal domain-containing protein, partial [Sphingobacteriaceae bacterium]
DAFTGSLNRTSGENFGSYAINKNTLALNSNYILNYSSANFILNKKQLTITADNKTKAYNTPNPILTASYSGFAGIENQSVLQTPVLLTTTATLTSLPGTYSISANGATASNYNINFVQGTLTIGTNNGQLITFAALADKLSNDVPFNLTASSSVGLIISYTSSDPTIARIINGNQVEILKAGTVTITATQSGNANYAAATPVSQLLRILDNQIPVITIESDLGVNIRKGDEAVLTAVGASTYVWSNANGIIGAQTTNKLTVRPSENTTYTVTGANAFGRTSTQTITITVKEDLSVIVTSPATNIISPNGDGVNDYFVVKNIDLYPNNTIVIYDRSGKTLYKVKSYKNTWDGSVNGLLLEEGTYYYIIDFGDGKTTSKKGFITIVKQ